MSTVSAYTAKDITVLEGLEPVRKRPGMYIGGVDTRGLHHLVNEIVDNAIDEVINGYATRLEVTLFEGGREIEVTDNGRGIPVDVHPKYKTPWNALHLQTAFFLVVAFLVGHILGPQTIWFWLSSVTRTAVWARPPAPACPC